MLHIKNLTVSRDQKIILSDCTLSLNAGTTHAIMGPNGSGKSTLAYALMGHPLYTVQGGSLLFNGADLLALSPDKRAQAGLFLAFQQPVEIPGVKVIDFLKEAYQAVTKSSIQARDFITLINQALDFLQMDYSFAYRSLNESFSGGEKKRLELLQILILKPQLIVLDEIDSGLDIDALKLVGQVINHVRNENNKVTVLCITHYNRLLEHLAVDYVHVLKHGTIRATGSMALAQHIQEKGYDVIA
jgi:Fe-S cluster assembly ATP-binding protein